MEKLPGVTNSELAVLDVLWERSEAMVREVVEPEINVLPTY